MDLLIARMEDPKFKMGSPLRKHSDPLDKPNIKTNDKEPAKINSESGEQFFKGYKLSHRGSDIDPNSVETEEPSSPTLSINNKINNWKDDFDKHKIDFKNFRIRYKNPENMHSGGSAVKRSSFPVSTKNALEVNSVSAGNRKRSLPIDSTFKDTIGPMDEIASLQNPADGSRDSIGPDIDDPNYTVPKQDWSSPLPDFGRSASPTLRERRMSGFPELDRGVSPNLRNSSGGGVGRRSSMWNGSRNPSAINANEPPRIIRPEPEINWRLHPSSSRPRSPQMGGDRRTSMLPVLEDFAIRTAKEEGELDPNTPEPYRPASPTIPERRMSGFPELGRSASPTLRERRMSGFPELDRTGSSPFSDRRWSDRSASPTLKERRNSGFPELDGNRSSPFSDRRWSDRSASPTLKERRNSGFPEFDRPRSTSPIFDDRKRIQSTLPSIDTGNQDLRGRRASMYSDGVSRSRSGSSASASPIRWQRRATMIPELERGKTHSPVQQQMRRKSMFPEVKTVDNNAAKNKNRFKTFDFKSFQFPLSAPGETIEEEEDKFDDIPGKGEYSSVIKEQKVNRNNGRNKVHTIQDDNEYDDVNGTGHVRNIFTALIQQEKERDKEREKHHHQHVHHGITDYTSATTGTFSDVMFNGNERNSGTQSNSNSNSGSCSSLFVANEVTSQNETITSKEGTGTGETSMGTATPAAGAIMSSNKNPVINKILNIDGKTTHRHHKSLSADSKGTSFVNDKKRLVYQFLQSMAPPSKNQLQKQGLLFTSESPLVSSHSFAKPSAPLGNGVGISSNKSLQSLLFHDLEHPESINHSRPSSPYSKSSYSLSSYSSSSTSSTSSSSLSDSYESESYDESSTNKNEDQMEDLLDRYEVDYYQQHIALLLAKFDDIMKTHLKDAILKKETDFQKSLQTFDKLVLDLQTLKQKTIDLKALIKETYMVKLSKDFKENDSTSFITGLQNNVGQNIKQLEAFESRMKKCQDKLVEQKEELKRMENLLQIEQGIIESKKSLGFFPKYRYVIFDTLSLFLIVFIVMIFIFPLKFKVIFTSRTS